LKSIKSECIINWIERRIDMIKSKSSFDADFEKGLSYVYLSFKIKIKNKFCIQKRLLQCGRKYDESAL